MQQPFINYGTTTATPSMGTPVNNCRMTRQELQRLLEQSNFGANASMFNCYFRPGSPPVCINCNRAIHQHEADNATTSVTISSALAASPLQMVDPNALPTGFKREGQVDKFTNWWLLGILIAGVLNLCIGLLLFGVFAASGLFRRSAVTMIGPFICTTIGLTFCLFPKRFQIKFDRSCHRWTYHRSRAIFPCWSCGKKEGSFGEIVSVTTETSLTSNNNLPSVFIVMNTSNGEAMKLELADVLTAPTKVAIWQNYIQRLTEHSQCKVV